MTTARVTGLVTVFIALSVLLLQAVNPFWWTGLSHDAVAMQPNTSLGLIAAGLALWLLVDRRRGQWFRRFGYAAAAFVTLLGAFTLLELVLRVHLGIDHLLPGGSALGAQISAKGQMGPNTAFCILAIGVALLLINLRGAAHGWAIQLPAVIVWLISLAAIIGYLDDVRGLHAIQAYSDMSVLTSVLLFVLSTGALFARPGAGFIRHMAEGNPGSTLLRRMLPLTVIIPLAIGWFRLRGEKVGWYSLDGSAVVFTVVDMMFFIIFILLAIAPLNAMLREVRRTSDRTAKEKATLAAILESADHSIISTDRNGLVTTFNLASEHWLGYRAEDVIGKKSLAALHDWKEVKERANQLSTELQRQVIPGFEALVARARAGFAEEQQWSYLRKDGSRLPVSQTITALHDEEGTTIGFVAIASDITERLEMDRMKSEFISTVSHELRTPLTSIRGSLALLEGGMVDGLSGEARSLVHIAHKNSVRLIRLVNDILDVEKIAAGKMVFNFGQYSLDAILNECLRSNNEYASQYDVTFVLHNDLPDATVEVDADRLSQVMANLLSNAAKFSRAGGAVDVGVESGPLGVRVSVADRGAGITEDFRSQLFNRFAQGDSSDRRRTGGTGLGLSISKAIIEHMNGAIGYEPRAGGGSVFYFDLPATTTGAAPVEQVQSVAAEDPCVLICEDDRETASELAEILNAGGFRTDVVSDVASARSKVATGAYDAMTLDILLPDEDGLSFVRDLRAKPETVDLPIIVVSMAPKAEVGEGIRSGILEPLDWVKKPVDPTRLLKLLHEALRFGGQQRVKVLHVEDDADLRAVVRSALSDAMDVTSACDLTEARRCLAQDTYDLVILDLMLPDGSGDQLIDLDVLKIAQVPVLVFSAYEPGPELAARVATVLAKSRTTNEEFLETVRRLVWRHRHRHRHQARPEA